MAILAAGAASIEIRPFQKETPTGPWIDTVVGVTYHMQHQRMHIVSPPTAISLQAQEFAKFIGKSRDYIANLPVRSKKSSFSSDACHFSPMEARFFVTLIGGSFTDTTREDGHMLVEFELALIALEVPTLIGDSIGCSLKVTIRDMWCFLDTLEREVAEVLTH